MKAELHEINLSTSYYRLILTACQPIWSYFKSRGIFHAYIHKFLLIS